MKILAINSSPKKERGNTALLLDAFLEGAKEVGAEVDLVYTRDLDLKPCLGDLGCWLKKPGECLQKDDMQQLLPRMRDADVWVLATPLYFDGMSGPMKNLMDRSIPLAEPFFEVIEGHCRHPLRQGVKGGKLVLLSTCGFWERDNFDPLVTHVKAICANAQLEFAGALLRPHGAGLRQMRKAGLPMNDVFEAAKEAGRQLVRDGKLSPETLDTVSRELLPRDMYIQLANDAFRKALASRE